MSEAVIYKRLKLTTRIFGNTIEAYSPAGRWERVGSIPLATARTSARAIREAVDNWLRATAKTATETWPEGRLEGLQDAADRLEENYHPARRRWIAALIRAREVKP
jgi:acyl-CoA reductase-like NAD-dependent aldehyde dehydrogenase